MNPEEKNKIKFWEPRARFLAQEIDLHLIIEASCIQIQRHCMYVPVQVMNL